MNVTQIEYRDAFSEPLPTTDTLDRGHQLFIARAALVRTITNKKQLLAYGDRSSWPPGFRYQRAQLLNEIAQDAMRLTRLIRQIAQVAGEIYSEYAAAEIHLNISNAADEIRARRALAETA